MSFFWLNNPWIIFYYDAHKNILSENLLNFKNLVYLTRTIGYKGFRTDFYYGNSLADICKVCSNIAESMQCNTESMQCNTENMQSITESIQCITESMQCITANMQCITESMQCITEKIQCITESMQSITENTIHTYTQVH